MRTLIVPVEHVETARAFAARVPDGAGMFSRACGTVDADTGEESVTDYLSHYTVETHYLAAYLPYKSWFEDEEGNWQSQDHPGDVPRLLDELGISPAEQDAALAILAQLDISDQSAEAACARLGIVML